MRLPIYIYPSMFARNIRDPASRTAEDLQSADAATEKAGGSAGAGFKPAGVLDFSSASEDEDPCCSRSKSSETHTGEEGGAGATCIGNMGLYALLQRQMAQRQRQEMDSDEDSSSQDEDNCEKPTMIKEQTSKTRDLSVQSREGLEEVTDHKQQKKSADLELLPTRSQKHNNDSKNHFHKTVKFVEERPEDDIERFFSSEDEAPQEGIRCVKGPSPQDNKSADRWSSGRDNTTQKSLGMKSRNSLQPSGSDKTQSRDEDKNRTLDSLLGGLQHVSYTHSNQKIVGSSRAEDHLSRAAVRDVFELNKHSQQLANQLLDSSESQASDHALKDHIDGGQTRQEYDSHLIKHPVTHTIKTSYRQKNVTVIVGETPSSMCRQQVEEMTQFFGFDSVRDFAEDILKNSSEQRLSRLRSFYSQKSPELKNIIKKAFLKPNIEPESYKQRPTSKRAHPNSSLKPQVEVPIPRAEDRTKTLKKMKMVETETSEVHLHSSTDLINNKMKMSSTGKFSSSVSGHVAQSSSTSALVERSKSNISSSSQPFKDKEGPSRSSRVSTDGCAASSSTQTSSSSQITELLGDTSILDDLFKSKRKTVDQPKDVKTSTCTERAKSRGKDFWDILNEGNEESINKLTDLTEVEKICNSVSVSTKSRSNEKTESSQLWRKNEKFLWKH